MAHPSSASNASRLATSTTLIPDAAICRVNSLPIPDEAPVTSAHGPNRPLSSDAFIVLFLSVDCTCVRGAPSPTVILRVLDKGRDPCDLPLESFRIREEGRPRALTHLVGTDLLVARDDAGDNRPCGVRR